MSASRVGAGWRAAGPGRRRGPGGRGGAGAHTSRHVERRWAPVAGGGARGRRHVAGAEAEAGAEARGGLEAAWAEAAGPGAPSRETAHAWNAAVPSGSPDGAAPPPPAPGPPPPPPTPTPAGAEKAAKALPTDTFGEAARAEAKAEEGKKKGLGSFGTRVVFGVVCGAVGGGLIFAGTWPFAFGLAFCALLCCNEYLTLQKNAKGMKQAPKSIRRTARVLVPSMIMAAQCGIRTGIFETASFVLLIMLLIKKSSKKKKKSRRVRFSLITSMVFCLFYTGYLTSFWVRIRLLKFPLAGFVAPQWFDSMVGWIGGEVTVGLMTTVLSVLCIISADSGAYLVGKRFGKNKLISISPNKTVEGAVGGALGAVGVALGFSKVITWPEPHVAAAMGFLVFLGSLFGDLIESSLKREANMKDAGDLIPGHGGVLDRFDSYLFTGVLVYGFWYYYYWFQGAPLESLFALRAPISLLR